MITTSLLLSASIASTLMAIYYYNKARKYKRLKLTFQCKAHGDVHLKVYELKTTFGNEVRVLLCSKCEKSPGCACSACQGEVQAPQ